MPQKSLAVSVGCVLLVGCLFQSPDTGDLLSVRKPEMRIAAGPLIGKSTLASSPQTPASSDEDVWTAADRAVIRLEPAVFPDLPLIVREEFERRGCTIPQSWTSREPHNAIQGRFTKAGQLDWAVLCSRERVSMILVFRGGRPDDVAAIASLEDRSFLQDVGGGSIGFSRVLGVARADFIREMNEHFGPAKLPPLDHEGINDIFADKGSSVWYWFAGEWLRLAGAD